MLRRTLFVGAAALLMGALVGCSGPIVKTETTAPATAFTPDAAKDLITQVNSIEDVELIYGDPVRAIRGKHKHAGMKGFVWEWVATRPAFTSKPNENAYFTPTVKKELQVWRDRSGKLVDAEVQGVFYVQTKWPALPMVIQEMRILTKEELGSVRVPIFSLEVNNVNDINTYYNK